MRFQTIIKQDGPWFIACTPDVPGANGQGRSVEQCLQNLAEVVELIEEDRHVGGDSARADWR